MNAPEAHAGAAVLRAADGPFLGPGAARRLCIDLIAAEQERLLRSRRISPRQRIEVLLSGCAPGTEDDIEIGEDALGFDSLMLLDLVSVISRFFSLTDSGAEDLLLVHRTLGEWARIVVSHFERVGSAARIGFETSGTTGKPKTVLYTAATLNGEVDAYLSSGIAPPMERVLSCVPPRHIYGFLWGVLLPQRAGVAALDLHRSAGETLFRLCREGDLVIGTPFTWDRAAVLGQELPPRVSGVTSGGPSTDATWSAAQTLRLERMLEIYGSTETGGIGWRQSGRDGFRLLDNFLRTHNTLRHSSGEAVHLQDLLLWMDETTFELGGRLDGCVQVAGTNVSLDTVGTLLRSAPDVAEAVVRLDGSRIAAFIVPSRPHLDLDDLETSLRALARKELPAAARPDRYRFDVAIPRTSMGKVMPW
jgi:4-coumarate--CoA ligase